MGNVKAVAALLLALVACGGPAANPPQEPGAATATASRPQAEPVETFQAAQYELSLIERDDKCYVSHSGHGRSGELAMALTPPCRVVMRPNGAEPQQVIYDDIGATVLIIVGTPGEEAGPPLEPPAYCGTESQGLILTGAQAALSERVGRGRKCNLGEDEKEFWLFAH